MAKMRECPVCGIRVKVENLETHLNKVHPKTKVDVDLSEDDKVAIKIAKKSEKKRMAPFEERERKKWMLAGILITVIIIVLIILMTSFGPGGPGCDLEGEYANYFMRGDVEGNQIDLDVQYQSHDLVVLEFFQTGCGACQSQAPIMHDLHQHYIDQGESVAFIAISSSPEDSVQAVRDFRDNYGGGGTMTYIWDSAFSISGDYCVQFTPTFVIIDSEGIIVKWFYRYQTFDQMTAIIDDLLPA
ncbi:MAG: TlpA family protein disulfide reductase [Methanobacteriota archaeon]|nr:MAG: TlpA family protein disulfide reductase [Euryarchaeota archaeon]